MKFSTLACAILLVGVTQGAIASCGDPQVMNSLIHPTVLQDLLTGNTVCVVSSHPGWGWENQEAHMSGGALVDYKKGPGDPVDPTTPVGTWSVSGTGNTTVINYLYTDSSGSTPTGPFEVHTADSVNVSFCQGSTLVVQATLVPGTGGCGAPPP